MNTNALKVVETVEAPAVDLAQLQHKLARLRAMLAVITGPHGVEVLDDDETANLYLAVCFDLAAEAHAIVSP